MSIKRVRRAALVFLVASVAQGVIASSASAISQGRANQLTHAYTWDRAACSSSYWRCTNFFGPRCSLTGHNSRGLAQWACTEFVFRQKRHFKFWQSSNAQACGVSASWDPYGGQTHGFIKCQYTVENSKNHRLARAITKSHAESVTSAYAWSRSACGGPYWVCTSFFGPYCQDTAHNQRGEAQWVCSTTTFRSKRHHKFWESAHGQACLVELHLDPYAHPTYGHIRCQYTVDNSRDRTRR